MFSVEHEGNNISDYCISFERNVQICTGVGTLDVTVTKNFPYSFTTWDTVVLYESASKKGTFNIASITRDASTGNYTVNCQDNSKRLIDYFITDTWEITTLQYARPWIETFLTLAGVSYSFTVADQGSALSENTSLGLSSAYDSIIPLLQMSGWYMYFDADGVCIIGDLQRSLEAYSESYTGHDIIDLQIETDDRMLRNRAVVWGNGDAYTGTQVFADISTDTPWNYDTLDKRAIVLANGGVRNSAQALELATVMLDEFDSLTEIKTVQIAGYSDVSVGDIVRIDTDYHNDVSLITTLSSAGSRNGYITTLTLDERCPRLFGFFSTVGDYVYVGTSGAGVWRKPLNSSAWENFSVGLPSGCIVLDMFINSDLFGIITASGEVYYRRTLTNWTPFTISGFYDENSNFYAPSSVIPKGITINHTSNHIVTGYVTASGRRSWAVEFDSTGGVIRSDKVYRGTGYDVVLTDLDTNDTTNMILAEDIAPGEIENLGIKSNQPPSINETDSFVILPESTNQHVIRNVDYVDSSTTFSSGGWTYPLVQFLGSSRIYSYHIKSVGSTVTAYRVKYTPVWGGSSWSITQSQTSVAMGVISFSFTNRRYYYKTSINDDRLYTTVLSYQSFSPFLIYFSHWTIDFNAGTSTAGTTPTYDITGYNSLGNPVQRDNYIWQAFYKINGTQVDVYWFKYDQLTESLETGHIWKLFSEDDIGEGLTIVANPEVGDTNPTPSFAVKQDNSGFIWTFPYRGDNEVATYNYGFIYGNETDLFNVIAEWKPLGDFEVSQYVVQEQTAGYAGDTAYKVGVFSAFTIRLFDSPTSNWYGYTAKMYLDNDLVPNILERQGYFPSQASFDTWWADEFMIHSTGYSTAVVKVQGFKTLSSKSFVVPLIAQLDYRASSTPLVRIIRMPDFEQVSILGTTAEHPGLTFSALQPADDFNQTIYIDVHPSGFLTEILGAYDLNTGSLIHIYDNITLLTTSFVYVSNGFIVKGVNDVTFMWPNNGYEYIFRSPGTVIKQTNELCQDVLYYPYLGYSLDIAKQNPVEVYPISASGFYPVYQSFLGNPPFTTILKTFPSYDGRTFDFSASGVSVASGIITGSGTLRYFGMVTGNELNAFNVYYPASGVVTVATIAGANHLETSKNITNPYFFISTSGISSSGRFYQRNPTDSFFTDYSVGLPISEITVIRMDDLI